MNPHNPSVPPFHSDPRGTHPRITGPGHALPGAHSGPLGPGATRPLFPPLTADVVLHSVRRWWMITAPLGLILGLAAGAYLWWTFVPEYLAEAWLHIEPRPPFIVSPGSGDSRFLSTQQELIRSPLVLEKAISQPEVARLSWIRETVNLGGSAVDLLRPGVDARSVGQSDLFLISYRAPAPADASLVANAILDAYLDLQDDRADEQNNMMIALLDREKERRVVELKALQEKVKTLSKQMTGQDAFNPRGGKELVLKYETPFEELQNKLVQAEFDRKLVEVQLETQRELLASQVADVPASAIQEAVETHPVVKALQEQIAATGQLLDEYRRRSARGDNDPEVGRLEQKLAKLNADLVAGRQELQPQMEDFVREQSRRDRQTTVDKLAADVESAKMLEQLLARQIAEKRGALERVSDRSLELEFARDEMRREEQVFQLIGERVTEMRTEQRAPARVQLRYRATPPQAPVEDLPYIKIFGVGGAGFLFPFALAVLWEWRARRIADPRQVHDEINLQVLGEIPTIPVTSLIPGRMGGERYERHQAIYEESIESLRTALMFSIELRDMQIFVVSSAVSREGKTSLASRLAVSIANCCHQPTLVIDGDMRAPDLHEMFDVPLEPGLAQVLDHQCSLQDAIVTTWSPHLHVLTAGKLTRNPYTLLSDGKLEALLGQLRTKYRYIVVDAPPVLAASEAVIVARAGDGTLVCTMRDVSRAPQLRIACQRMAAAGARLLGVVVSGIPARNYAYKYGGYEYYSRRYKPVVDADFEPGTEIVLANPRGAAFGPAPSTPPSSDAPQEPTRSGDPPPTSPPSA